MTLADEIEYWLEQAFDDDRCSVGMVNAFKRKFLGRLKALETERDQLQQAKVERIRH